MHYANPVLLQLDFANGKFEAVRALGSIPVAELEAVVRQVAAGLPSHYRQAVCAPDKHPGALTEIISGGVYELASIPSPVSEEGRAVMVLMAKQVLQDKYSFEGIGARASEARFDELLGYRQPETLWERINFSVNGQKPEVGRLPADKGYSGRRVMTRL